MKNILIKCAVVLCVMFIITSCRKERTCECKNTITLVRTGNNATTMTYNTSSKVTMSKQKKAEFRDRESCYSYKTVDTDSGGSGPSAYTEQTTTEVNCELK